MRILPFLVLLSAIGIAGVAAFFSVIGLKLLFVGGGVSIIVMGVALEVGKLITATFLKQKWNEIGLLLKIYMTAATLVLVAITSVGIYGYLTAGYTATSVAVQGYERTIESNTSKISDLEKEIALLKSDKYNETEVVDINANRKSFIEQRLQLVSQKNQQIEKIRATSGEDKGNGADIIAAKQALELSKQALDSDTSRELDQIKLYNSRLEILDKEVQKWIDEGGGSLFKKSGLERARETKESQKNERAEIDTQIKSAQQRMEKLRAAYEVQVKEYNDRVATIEARGKNQRSNVEDSVKTIQKEISDIMASIDSYNKETDAKIGDMGKRKNELSEQNKKKAEEHQATIKSLYLEIDAARKAIVNTDVGTFKFIAKILGIELDKAVNYFVFAIMLVFDPLAVCLILAYNSLIQDKKPKREKEIQEPKIEKVELPVVVDVPSTIATQPVSVVEVKPEPTAPQLEEPAAEIKFVVPNAPPTPLAPHGITSGKNHPHNNI